LVFNYSSSSPFARVLSNFLPSLESMFVAFLWGAPITTLCDGSTHRLFPCSTGAQQSSPLSIHLSRLAGWCIAMSGMPTLICKTHYDPCSQAKIGGTLRQLDKRNVYCSIRNVSVQMASILLQTEMDSCQTKVSVPVNTELRVPSSTTWHDYLLTKRKLGNQRK